MRMQVLDPAMVCLSGMLAGMQEDDETWWCTSREIVCTVVEARVVEVAEVVCLFV